MPNINWGSVTAEKVKNDSFRRNILRGMRTATSEAIKEFSPVAHAVVSNNKQIVAKTYKKVKSQPDNDANLKNSYLWKSGQQMIKNALDDIKTGRLDNKQREAEAVNESMKAMGFDFDFDMSDFDDDSWFDENSSTDIFESENGDTIVNKHKTQNVIINKADMSSTMSGIAQLTKAVVTTNARGYASVNKALSTLVTFQSSQTITFYNDMSNKFSMMANSLETINRNIYEMTNLEVARLNINTEQNQLKSLLGSNQLLSIDYYRDRLKGKDGKRDDGEKLHPVVNIMKKTIQMITPNIVKTVFDETNKLMEILPVALMAKFREFEKSKNGLLQFLGRTFSKDFKSTSYHKGPVAFDGVTRKAIVHVIPSLLSKILNSLKGGKKNDELIYDYDRGGFTTSGNIKRAAYNEVNEAVNKSSEISIFSDNVKKSYGNMNSKDIKDFNNALRFMVRHKKNPGFDKFIKNPRMQEAFFNAWNSLSSSDKVKLTKAINSVQSPEDFINSNESFHNAFNMLTYDNLLPEKVKSEPSFKKAMYDWLIGNGNINAAKLFKEKKSDNRNNLSKWNPLYYLVEGMRFTNDTIVDVLMGDGTKTKGLAGELQNRITDNIRRPLDQQIENIKNKYKNREKKDKTDNKKIIKELGLGEFSVTVRDFYGEVTGYISEKASKDKKKNNFRTFMNDHFSKPLSTILEESVINPLRTGMSFLGRSIRSLFSTLGNKIAGFFNKKNIKLPENKKIDFNNVKNRVKRVKLKKPNSDTGNMLVSKEEDNSDDIFEEAIQESSSVESVLAQTESSFNPQLSALENKIVSSNTDLIKSIRSNISLPMRNLAKTVTSTVNKHSEEKSSLVENIKGGLVKEYTLHMSNINIVLTKFYKKYIQLNEIKDKEGILTKLSNTRDKIKDNLSKFSKFIPNFIKNSASSTFNKVKNGFKKLGEKRDETFEKHFGLFAPIIPNPIMYALLPGMALKNAIKNRKNNNKEDDSNEDNKKESVNKFTSVFNFDFFGSFKSIGETISQSTNDIFTTIKDRSDGVFESLKDVTKGIFDFSTTFVKEDLPKIGENLVRNTKKVSKETINTISGFAKESFGEFKNQAKRVFGGAVDMFSNSTDRFKKFLQQMQQRRINVVIEGGYLTGIREVISVRRAKKSDYERQKELMNEEAIKRQLEEDKLNATADESKSTIASRISDRLKRIKDTFFGMVKSIGGSVLNMASSTLSTVLGGTIAGKVFDGAKGLVGKIKGLSNKGRGNVAEMTGKLDALKATPVYVVGGSLDNGISFEDALNGRGGSRRKIKGGKGKKIKAGKVGKAGKLTGVLGKVASKFPKVASLIPKITGLIGGAGGLGGILSTVAGVLSGPVGWALLGTAAIGGIGATIFKKRKAKKEEEERQRAVQEQMYNLGMSEENNLGSNIQEKSSRFGSMLRLGASALGGPVASLAISYSDMQKYRKYKREEVVAEKAFLNKLSNAEREEYLANKNHNVFQAMLNSQNGGKFVRLILNSAFLGDGLIGTFYKQQQQMANMFKLAAGGNNGSCSNETTTTDSGGSGGTTSSGGSTGSIDTSVNTSFTQAASDYQVNGNTYKGTYQYTADSEKSSGGNPSNYSSYSKVGDQISVDSLVNRPLWQQSPTTAQAIDDWVASKTKSKTNSKLRGLGGAIIRAARLTGLDPLYITAHAAEESGWGTSKYAMDRNNFFGIGAYNSNPDNAHNMGNSPEQGILAGAKFIANEYAFSKYGQDTLYKMVDHEWHNYCVKNNVGDKGWAKRIASIWAGGPVVGNASGRSAVTPAARGRSVQSVPVESYGIAPISNLASRGYSRASNIKSSNTKMSSSKLNSSKYGDIQQLINAINSNPELSNNSSLKLLEHAVILLTKITDNTEEFANKEDFVEIVDSKGRNIFNGGSSKGYSVNDVSSKISVIARGA